MSDLRRFNPGEMLTVEQRKLGRAKAGLNSIRSSVYFAPEAYHRISRSIPGYSGDFSCKCNSRVAVDDRVLDFLGRSCLGVPI